MTEVVVYGKEGCGICEAAVEKFKLMGVPSSRVDISRHVEFHEGWQHDGSVEVSSAFFANDQKLPLVKIGQEYFSYPQAMRRMKERGLHS